MRDTVAAADALIDVITPVLDHGFVALVDYMGSDKAIVQAARTSTGRDKDEHTLEQDRALIRRLMRDRHTSPLEMVELKFNCCMPIFVARQWIRHRTANVNEMSGRYRELPELYYVPEKERISWQSPVNKQGSGAQVSDELAARIQQVLSANADASFATYHELLGKDGSRFEFDGAEFGEIVENGGVTRELARIGLPVTTYTQWYWKIDLHNLLHFLGLRLDPHAQWEIRQYAEVMANAVKALCPLVWEAFEDFRLHAVTLSGPEVEAIKHCVAFYLGTTEYPAFKSRLTGKSDLEIFKKQLDRLGLSFLNQVEGSDSTVF